jgi:hypothetical protein
MKIWLQLQDKIKNKHWTESKCDVENWDGDGG